MEGFKDLIPDLVHLTSAAPIAETVLVPSSSSTNVHKTVKTFMLVPHTPKSNNWGSWQVKRSQLTSTTASPNSAYREPEQEPKPEQEQGEDIKQGYQLRSPCYSAVHPLEFYDDE